jgi:hypothetical protein
MSALILCYSNEGSTGKQPRMSRSTGDKSPQVPTKPDPTDEELIAAGTVVARTLEANFAPGMNEVNP